MKVSLSVDESGWLQLPQLSGEGPAARWEDGVVERMRGAWQGALDAGSEALVREALRNGLRQVSENDSVTLQYWPTASIANAVVRVSASEFTPEDARLELPLADIRYAAQPISSLFETEALGIGVESRYLTPVDDDSSMLLAGVNYLFENDFGYVAIGVEPTVPWLVGLMLEPLRDVVRSIQVVGDTAGQWTRCTGPEVELPARGEDWSFESAGPGQSPAEARL